MDTTRLSGASTADTRPSERGASLVEYALLVVLIALVALVAIETLGGGLAIRYAQFAGMFDR